MVTNGSSKGKEMSDIPKKSLLLDLENAILAVESAGFDDMAIHSFVNMILKGFITNGTWTPEYLQAAAEALQQRQREMTSRTIDTPPSIITSLK